MTQDKEEPVNLFKDLSTEDLDMIYGNQAYEQSLDSITDEVFQEVSRRINKGNDE